MKDSNSKEKKDKNKHGKKKESKKENSDLKKEIVELKDQLKEKNDKLLRTLADLQNYQKRMEKERQSIKIDTKKKYLNEIIELYELLNKAYDDNNPKKGLKLLLKNIENFFEKEQIKCINCKGKNFDHNYHHAITTVEKNDCRDDTIVEEVKKGYMMGDKLLRPAQVIVAKKNKNEN